MKATAMSDTIMPPATTYKRARSRAMFDKTFNPKVSGRLYEPADLPTNPDEHHWWTVVDLDPNGQHFYLTPGFRFANRLGFVETERAWGGSADEHPLYVY